MNENEKYFISIDKVKIIELKVATNMYERMKGLMGTKNISFALFFHPCNNVHTFFMKEPIDVLYLNKENKIIDLDVNLKPWRIGRIIKGSKTVIELPYGTIEKYNIVKGKEVFLSILKKD